MKKLIPISFSILVLFFAGCSAKPHIPHQNLTQAGIKPDDSIALSIAKLSRVLHHLHDVETESDDIKKGGYSLTHSAFDLATGSIGIGLSNSVGLAGGLTSMGIGFLLSPSYKPPTRFTLIYILPSHIEFNYADRVKSALSPYKIIKSKTSQREKTDFIITNQLTTDLENSKASDGSIKFNYIYKHLISSTISGNELGTLLGKKMKHTSYNVFIAPLAPELANLFIKNRGFVENDEIAYMYLPKHTYSFKSLPEIEDYILKVPYILELNNKKAHLFIKPKIS